MFPTASRVAQYTPYEYTELTMNSLSYPVTLSQISKFEKQNHLLSINVFGFDGIVFPLHITGKRNRKHVNLLPIANEAGYQHYCLIINLSRLLGTAHIITGRVSTEITIFMPSLNNLF